MHTEELLDRLGYDPNGALYNAVGTVQTSQFSTGGFEKKTREWEGNADYQQLANAIAESVPLATRQNQRIRNDRSAERDQLPGRGAFRAGER